MDEPLFHSYATHESFSAMIGHAYSYQNTSIRDRTFFYNAAAQAGYRVVEIMDDGVIYLNIEV